jgi:hypothetical protein
LRRIAMQIQENLSFLRRQESQLHFAPHPRRITLMDATPVHTRASRIPTGCIR